MTAWVKKLSFTGAGTQTFDAADSDGFDAIEFDITVDGATATVETLKFGHSNYQVKATLADDSVILTAAAVLSFRVTTDAAATVTIAKVER